MRRVAILQQVQKPPRCQRVEDLGAALEDWLSKKRHYETFTDRNGRPCQASDDSLVDFRTSMQFDFLQLLTFFLRKEKFKHFLPII